MAISAAWRALPCPCNRPSRSSRSFVPVVCAFVTSEWRSARVLVCRSVLSEPVGDRVAPVAPEALSRDLHTGGRLAALVLGEVEQPLHARDGGTWETARHDLGDAQL